MRFSKLFGKTLREVPTNVQRPGEQYALRAALLRSGTQWVNWLPLGYAALGRMHGLASQALSALGGQEAYVVVTPDTAGLFQGDIVSYRDLPRLTYRMHTGHSISAAAFNRNQADSESSQREVGQVFFELLQASGVASIAVESGPDETHWVTVNPLGDQELLTCGSPECGYHAKSELARFKAPEGPSAESGALLKVATPHCNTIAELARFLNIETRQTLKAVMYTADTGEFVFVVVRGDLEVSQAKLLRILKARSLRPATEAEIAAAGAVPGYASPVGLKVAPSLKERGRGRVTVIADSSVLQGANFAAGANEPGFHFTQVNYPRDFNASLVADVAQAQIGSACPACGRPLRLERSFELGGAQHAGPVGLNYLSDAGRPEPVWLDIFWLRPEAVLLASLDQHHDEVGIVWPDALTPADVHLVRLGKAPETLVAADQLYLDLQAAGHRVFYDDREESAGVKFTDADLIGLPVRVTVSDKSLKAGGVEVKRRSSPDKVVVALANLFGAL